MRCINIDWLECYCLEDPLSFPHDADYFRREGWTVVQRDYGTPMYHEMFTLYDRQNEPLIEVRRNVKSESKLGGLFPFNACHVRLHNRTCYFNEPVKLLQQFLEQYGLQYQRISRVDLALDFELFDSGDVPQQFLRRYMAGKYAKINQANISAHGRDQWDGREWNSLSWGQRKSMVGTKFYNKTMELTEASDKPYIRHAWCAAGLIDDPVRMTKRDASGAVYQPAIWRVEFSIKSGTRNWFVVEDWRGARRKIRSMRNDLACYDSKAKILTVFFSLADHYFHFKHVERDGCNLRRKDRCADKPLFKPKAVELEQFYKLENVATTSEKSKALVRLIQRIEQYRDSHFNREVYKACNTLIQYIRYEQDICDMAVPWPADDVKALQLLLSWRLKGDTDATFEQVKTMLQTAEDALF